MTTALKTEPTHAEVDGHRLKCLMCQCESFHKRRSHVDISLTTSMNPEWADRQVSVLVCDHCGYIHWFMAK
jgi:hypothetical protein